VEKVIANADNQDIKSSQDVEMTDEEVKEDPQESKN